MIMYQIQYNTNEYKINKAMQFQKSQQIIPFILGKLDAKVWENIAVKAIQKMAPHKLTTESNKMFNDFTFLNSNIRKDSGTLIKEQPDDTKKITQNYILGTSKLIERPIRSKSSRGNELPTKQNLLSKGDLKRLKTISHEQQASLKQGPKKNNFFQLNHQQKYDIQQQKFDEILRNTKQSDAKYNKTLQNVYKQTLAEREKKIAIQRKKFKEMKGFTYDFEGRLLSTGQQKRSSNMNVLRVNSQLNQQMQIASRNSKKLSQPKVNVVVNKKIIEQQKNQVELLKEKKDKVLQQQEKQRQQKKSAFDKGISAINIMDIFKNENKMSIGVHITELSSKSRVSGRTRDKDDLKNLNLLEYKDQRKPVEIFPEHRQKKAAKTTSYFRTEGNDPQFIRERGRVKTQTNQFSRKNATTSLSKYSKFRGVIRISNQKLYSQNFSQAIQQGQ